MVLQQEAERQEGQKFFEVVEDSTFETLIFFSPKLKKIAVIIYYFL